MNKGTFKKKKKTIKIGPANIDNLDESDKSDDEDEFLKMG